MENAYTFWLIGLPSSGKTTLASSVKEQFDLIHLDSDEARKYLTPTPNYSKEEREIVYRSLIYICKLFNEMGRSVIVSATANLEEYRKAAKAILHNYKEIYIECPFEVCEKRDVKGLYKKSRNKEINTVPFKIVGENDQYVCKNYGDAVVFDFPTESDLVINTAKLSKECSIKKLSEFINKITRGG